MSLFNREPPVEEGPSSTMTCPDGQSAQLINGTWQCADDNTDNGMAEETEEPIDDPTLNFCADGYEWDQYYAWGDADGTYLGACVPTGGAVCAPDHHWQPYGDGTGGICAPNGIVAAAGGAHTETVMVEVFDTSVTTTATTSEELEAVMADFPFFEPYVSCCATSLGNALATTLLESYKSDLLSI